jgi:tRNA threonylcarbamoyladenosine biosynthesis protein TsaE
MTNQSSLSLYLEDAHATESVGARLSSCLCGGLVLTLAGDLGTGKTTLVRGLLRALGVTGSVKSPTYTLVESYNVSSLDLYHFDFYRFSDPEEWESTGFADYFRPDSVCLVEWPERVAGFLPVPDVALTLSHAIPPQSGRALSASANSSAGKRCVDTLRERYSAPGARTA